MATAYLGLIPSDLDPVLPEDTAWHPVDALPTTAFDHGSIVGSALAGSGRSSPTRIVGFALAPPTFTIAELREIYVAALGYEVTATNLQRVLLRRGVLEATGEHTASGRAGGRRRCSTASHHRRWRSPTRSPSSGRRRQGRPLRHD